MKTREQVSAQKMRGGFYSPASLVRFCLDRVVALAPRADHLSALEPSAGDGAFIRGLRAHQLADRVSSVVAIEPLRAEAVKCESELDGAFPGRVIADSFIPWAAKSCDEFDVAVGNPPFVRFQFVDADSKQDIERLADRLGVSFRGVSNLWQPIILGALDRLRPGGAFAFVIPAESFTGVSASVVREWLLRATDKLQFDLFPPGSFPGVLQEVVVMSGVRRRSPRPGAARVRVREHRERGRSRAWSHLVVADTATWTRYLLTPSQIDAVEAAHNLEVVRQLGEVARFEVACVTGANEYFSVDDETVERWGLAPWAVPLLPRSRHARGLVFRPADHRRLVAEGVKASLLHFSADRPDPRLSGAASEFISGGEALGLHLRFKTRIREPWYRIPHVRAGRLMLSKRSHRYPRVILNAAGAITTDTIYRGEMGPGFAPRESDFVAAFHNSLTLLTAEIEGRSFGGGVLELVPSETSRLLVLLPDGFGRELERLNETAASGNESDGEALVEETDRLLRKYDIGFTDELVDTLRGARLELLQRRLDRN